MNRLAIFLAALLLPACSTLNKYGIGSKPALHCDREKRRASARVQLAGTTRA